MNFKALGMLYFYKKKACQKILLVAKLTTIMIIAACVHVSAKGFGQKISIVGKDMPLEKVFSLIEKESGFVFFLNYDILRDSKTVTFNIKDANIEEAMAVCLQDQPLEFKIIDRTITITRKRELIAHQEDAIITSQSEVIGVVSSENGDPLIGATVTIKSIKKTELTNERGEFVMKNVPNGTYWVEISFVGYEKHRTQIIVFNNTIKLMTALKVSNDILDETQVIAYGTTNRRLNVGNVTTVKGEDIEKQPVNNPLLALEGRVPGLFIIQSSGLSGAAVTVRIQGQNSIANGNEPFYVIDGVPYYSQLPSTGIDGILGSAVNTSGSAGSPFSYINPADIESVEILKDADATAIYGSRAANGAILITTKKGKVGKEKFDINLQQGWGQVTRKLAMLNTQQYLEMRHEAEANDGSAITSSDYDINGVWDSTRYTDWQKTLIGGTSQYTNINGSISGGTNAIQYLVGGTFHRETTVFPGNSSDQKGSVHFNLNTTSVNENFRFRFSGSYLIDNNQLPNTDLTTYAIKLAPDAPELFKTDGTLNWQPDPTGTSSWTNPLSYLYAKYKNKTNNLVSNATISYRILKGLEIRSSFGYTNTQTNDFIPIPLISMPPESRPYSQNVAVYGNRNLNSWIIEPQASYIRSISKGKMDLLIGATIQQNNSNGGSIAGIGYTSDLLLQNLGAATTVFSSSSFDNEYKYSALFGRLNYNWQNRFILDATARRDGSSRFGSQNQFHDFWSLGGAWIFSQESPFQNGGFISFGKVRFSYGTTGNDQIADYSFLSLYNILTSGVPYQNTNGLIANGLPNPYLEWEETHKLQLGIDFGFLKDRILVGGTYARNRSSNELLSYSLPSIVGFTGIARNFPATVQNSSWEFTINTVNIKGRNLTWTSSFNLTIPKNKLIAFPNIDSSSYFYSLIVGKPLNFIRASHFLGVDPATGGYQFSDSHGNATFSPAFDDQSIILDPFPRFYGGLSNSIRYKAFQIDFLFQFVKQLGQNIDFYNGTNFPGQFSTSASNQPITVLNRWQSPGNKTAIAKFSTVTGQYDAVQSDYFYNQNGSFVRLKNLSISWLLPDNWKQNLHFQSCRIYLQGQNLLTITHFKGMDPENQGTGSLPPLRVLTAGVQIEF